MESVWSRELRETTGAVLAGPGEIRDTARPTPSLRVNFGWTLAGNVIYAACLWAMLVVLAKLATPDAVGRFALGFAVTAPLFLLTNLHLRTVITTDSLGEETFPDYLGLRVVTSGIAMALVGLMVVFGGYANETALVILLIGACKAIESLSDICYGLAARRERMEQVAKSLVLRGALGLGAFAGMLMLGGSLVAATAVLGLVWLVVLAFWDARRAGAWPKFSRPSMVAMVRLSLPLGVGLMLVSLSLNMPRYFLDRERGESEVGVYSALAYFTLIGTTLVVALCQSTGPRLARYCLSGRPQEFTRLTAKLLALCAVLGAVGVLATWLGGSAFLRFVYREEYAAHSQVLTVLMVAGAFQYLGACLGTAATSMRLFRAQLPVQAAVGAITVLCCWLWIGQGGLAGAAWAAVASAVCAAVAFGALVWTHTREEAR